MTKFFLGETILRQTDNLSKALQNPVFSAAEGQEMENAVVETLKS